MVDKSETLIPVNREASDKLGVTRNACCKNLPTKTSTASSSIRGRPCLLTITADHHRVDNQRKLEATYLLSKRINDRGISQRPSLGGLRWDIRQGGAKLSEHQLGIEYFHRGNSERILYGQQ